MIHSNCIVVFNKDKSKVLFCERQKEPYAGRLNFVGGKLESGEASLTAAYRELQEETGITRSDIHLYHLMDFTYYHLSFVLEIYFGVLECDFDLQEEINPLVWLPIESDFADKDRFAGEQNIAHIINMALQYPLPDYYIPSKGRFIGVDGCRNGWITAIIEDRRLIVENHEHILDIVKKYHAFDAFLIDMPVGLQEFDSDIRPDGEARKMLAPRSSTVFPVPARQAVYEKGEEAQKQANQSVLGKSLAKQSLAIIPKIREIDEFLDTYSEYKNVICESHPELCFAQLKGEVLWSRKKEYTGFRERETILLNYLEKDDLAGLYNKAKDLKCSPDDVLDAVCLAVTAAFKTQGMCKTVPEQPQKDARGLLMQIVYPNLTRE